MEVKGRISAIADSKKFGTDQVDGTILKIEGFGDDKTWIKSRDYRSKFKADKGDMVSVEVETKEVKGKEYHNTTADSLKVLSAGSTAPKAPAKSSYNPDGARLGCAYNNACEDARTAKKIGDGEYIKKAFEFHLNNLNEFENPAPKEQPSVDTSVSADDLEDDLDSVFAKAV